MQPQPEYRFKWFLYCGFLYGWKSIVVLCWILDAGFLWLTGPAGFISKCRFWGESLLPWLNHRMIWSHARVFFKFDLLKKYFEIISIFLSFIYLYNVLPVSLNYLEYTKSIAWFLSWKRLNSVTNFCTFFAFLTFSLMVGIPWHEQVIIWTA